MQLFTIGHSNHKPEVVRDFLVRRGITHLVDVRSKPYSRFNSGFNREIWHKTLADAGIEYLFWGDALGGFATPDDEMALSIDRLVRYFAKRTGSVPVVMCSEGKACECHRHHWISRYLIANTSVQVTNLHPFKADEDPAGVGFQDGFNPSGRGLRWPPARPFHVSGDGLPSYVTLLGYACEDDAVSAAERACPGQPVTIDRV